MRSLLSPAAAQKKRVTPFLTEQGVRSGTSGDLVISSEAADRIIRES